jgi:hypothetical protein
VSPVRFHRLKLIARSPQHYLGYSEEQAVHLERGEAFHSVVLGGKRVTFYPGPVRRGKEYEAFAGANPGALILTRTEYDKVMPMAEAVLKHGLAMEVLAGKHEVEVAWSYLGRQCGSRIDCIGPEGAWVTELKSTRDASLGRFQWQALRMGWNAQLAFYGEAVRASGLGKPAAHFVVAVESAPPHVVAVRRLTDRALDQGRRAFRLWFERLLVCEASDHWPGYCEDIEDLDHPIEDDVGLVFPGDDDAEAA